MTENALAFDFYCDLGDGPRIVKPIEVSWQAFGNGPGTILFRFTCPDCRRLHQQTVEMVVERMEQGWAREQTNGQPRSPARNDPAVHGQRMRHPPPPPRGRLAVIAGEGQVMVWCQLCKRTPVAFVELQITGGKRNA